ncbi:hypothetical protein [Acetivibrio cellulolyticus]|uniref:hypothetical protein n=1 Tax=Acetivibrio cellulolyticus TaxID=35830 RepID=UPI0001E2D8DC|nr:hypothetical protein [Acetivibrio cellulolyticus]
MKRLGVITILIAILINTIGSNVMAKDTEREFSLCMAEKDQAYGHIGKKSIQSTEETNPETIQLDDEVSPENNTCDKDDKQSYWLSVHNTYKPEATPSSTGHNLTTRTHASADIQQEQIPCNSNRPKMWAQPSSQAHIPEVTPSNIACRPEAAPTFSGCDSGGWQHHSWNEYKPEATPSKIDCKPITTPFSGGCDSSGWQYHSWNEYNPEATPSNNGCNPLVPPSNTHKPVIASSDRERPRVWVTPPTNTYKQDPQTYNNDKPKNGFVQQPSEIESRNFDSTVLLTKPNSSNELSLINAELEKARQKLSDIRNKAQGQINAEIKSTQEKINEIGNRKDINSKQKDSKIKKFKDELELKVKQIEKDATKQVKDVIENQNSKIRSILN